MVDEGMPKNKKIDNPVMTNRLKMSLKAGVTDIDYSDYCGRRDNKTIVDDIQITI